MAETVDSGGYTVSRLDALGEGFGFRKVRGELGVTAFGVNAVVMPPGYDAGAHKHERQEGLYVVHSGAMSIELEGTEHTVETGGLVRVAPDTVRRIGNSGDDPLVYLAIGAGDGYVGRDGIKVDD